MRVELVTYRDQTATASPLGRIASAPAGVFVVVDGDNCCVPANCWPGEAVAAYSAFPLGAAGAVYRTSALPWPSSASGCGESVRAVGATDVAEPKLPPAGR